MTQLQPLELRQSIVTSRWEMIVGWRKLDQNTTCTNTFFTSRVVNIWNSLPNHVPET